MSFVVYLFVLLITAGSVAFGLDWASAPMSPMPASRYELHAAKAPEPAKKPEPVVAESKPAPQPAPAPPPKAVAALPPPAGPAPPPIVALEPVVAAPACDVDACTRAYHSFTAADCTYQPTDGPRRLCTKGNPPAAQTTAQALSTPPAARAQASCNVDACSAAYRSFTSADCTYQPLEGPRRLCEK